MLARYPIKNKVVRNSNSLASQNLQRIYGKIRNKIPLSKTANDQSFLRCSTPVT
jgi:hypothetical protein